jgi:hypothetical protein
MSVEDLSAVSEPIAQPSPAPAPPPARPQSPGRFKRLITHPLLYAFGAIVFATSVIGDQVTGRTDFANSELSKDVESRWGAPVVQAAPSVRYVQSGSVFTVLKPLALSKQHVEVDAQMNYRKRGLKYFSGFDFNFTGDYLLENPEGHDIDVAFVFPLEVDKSQVLLSELSFAVGGAPASLDLGGSGDRLVWTGRLPRGASQTVAIRYRARGLDSFVYKLDPSLPARDLKLHVGVEGGDNFDYPAGVLSAQSTSVTREKVTLDWAYPSLESGVSLGVVLPSQKEYDALVGTMTGRAWVPGLAFLVALLVLARKNKRPLLGLELVLAASVWAFFYVLVAYLGAFVHFYLAYAVASLGLGAAMTVWLRRLFPTESKWTPALLWVGTLVVPTGAVVLQGYTGLIYTLELLAGLLAAMALITRPAVRAFLSDALSPRKVEPCPTPLS